MTLLVREGLEPRQTLRQRLLLRVYSDRIKSYYMQNVSIKLELDFDEVRIKQLRMRLRFYQKKSSVPLLQCSQKDPFLSVTFLHLCAGQR